jgi:site-specific DNA recombinase
MRVATYVRVSTEEQGAKDRYGMKAQMSDIQQLCKRQKYEIVAQYSDMASGSRADRPGFQAMIYDARLKQWDAIVVSKMDRLSRNLSLMLVTTDDLAKKGIQIISVEEPTQDDKDNERLFRSIRGAFAEYERAKITGRTKGGRREKSKSGGYSGGRPQWGYVAQGHKLVVDEEQASTVQQIFRWRAQHLSRGEIARRLNSQGILTRTGKEWHTWQVSLVLRHRDMYKGKYSYAGVETKGQQQAIL